MLDHLFQSERAVAVFSDRTQLQRMLDFEGALAQAEARLGIIPAAAAQAIASQCDAGLLDHDVLRERALLSGNLAIPLVQQLTRLVRDSAPEAAGYVHWGATSQDVLDTALVLQLRELFAHEQDTLLQLCDVVAELSVRYRNTPMAGRTWLQQAVPITFGLKAAGWLDALLRHCERLGELESRVLVLQFGGAAGTLASLDDRGLVVASGLAAELGLAVPALPWHAHRDRIAEVAAWHGLLMGTLGKIARDLSLLLQTEIAEVSEAPAEGRGGSSTMPHKRNPVATATVLANVVRVPGLVATMLVAMSGEHERALGGWQAEWSTLPEICKLVLGSLETLASLLLELQVFPEQMRSNLDVTHGLLLAEAVSMALAKHVGKSQAHELVQAASHRAIERNLSLREALAEESKVTETISSADLDGLLDPANYIGDTQRMIDRVLDDFRCKRNILWRTMDNASPAAR